MSVRVRFAPSPTGALHIGGIRTALYNYLFAKKHKGKFILRIEDTDRNRLVDGAEKYIIDALEWVGIITDEGPDMEGESGPYRQSERLALYKASAEELFEKGKAYMAFDTQEELEKMRREKEEAGGAFLYNSLTRDQMRNSVSLPAEEVERLLADGTPYTIRLRIEPGQEIQHFDLIRGNVVFHSSELDDKILLKADGYPTYHLANIIDDRLMNITHVIRGEEWLPSTAHHILLYRAFEWDELMPGFAHLPLILKPNGQGKLSKRDGQKLGIPVFPTDWNGPDGEHFDGFREAGFLPEAVINFLAFQGWNPGDEKEIMSMDELIDRFSLERIGKSGSRFDYDKARWFNHQYIAMASADDLFLSVGERYLEAGYEFEKHHLEEIIGLLKERVTTINDFVPMSRYFFEEVSSYDLEPVQKKWNPEIKEAYLEIASLLEELPAFEPAHIETAIKEVSTENNIPFGSIFPALRVALTGESKGPDLFRTIALLGQDVVKDRLKKGLELFNF